MTANNTKNSFASLEPLFRDVADFGAGYRRQDPAETANLFLFGPKGTFTPIHNDLTNNMLVQILGRKKITQILAKRFRGFTTTRGCSARRSIQVSTRSVIPR